MSKKIALFLALFILVTAFVVPAKAEAYTTDDGALIVSASTTLKAEIRLNIYVALPASVLADETAYAVFTQNDNTVTQYVKDAKKNVETVFGTRVYRFSFDVAASDIYTEINFRLYGTVAGTAGSVISLYSATRDFTENGFKYSVAEYLSERAANSQSAEMRALANAMLDYGKAAAEYFDVETGYETEYSEDFVNFTTASFMMKRYKFTSLSTYKPEGFENAGMQLLIGPTVSYNVFLKFSAAANVGDYSVTLNGEAAELADSGNNTYYLTVDDIKATDLGNSFVLSVEKDGKHAEYEFSGLAYAYAVAATEGASDEQTAENFNFGKALYRYYQTARKYFRGEYVSPYTGKAYSEYDSTEKKFLDYDEAELEWIDHILDMLIAGEMDDIEKIVTVHDWMVMYITYDSVDLWNNKNQHLYSALEGLTVCAGYSKMFHMFMVELEIPCVWMTGVGHTDSGSENHAWNAVFVDEAWYFVDVTWDDPGMNGTTDYPDGTNLRYTYCLITLDEIRADHEDQSDLPSPIGESSEPHEKALAVGKRNARARIAEGIENGIPQNAYIIDTMDDTSAAGTALAAKLQEQAANGAESFTFSLFVAAPMPADPNEAGTILSNVINSGLYMAAYQAWSGNVEYTIKSYFVKDTYTELVMTLYKSA